MGIKLPFKSPSDNDLVSTLDLSKKVNKIVYNDQVLIDLSEDTVTVGDVGAGIKFHLPNGEQAVGTSKPSYTGNASAVDVLSGKTFMNSSGSATGTMTNRGAVSASVAAGSSYTIPAGYHNGSGKVTATDRVLSEYGNATAADVLSGKTFTSSAGRKVTGTLVSAISYSELSTGSVNISNYDYVVIGMAGWGTDNGAGGSYTTTVKYGSNTWSKTISHADKCDRATCGGLNKLVIDNTNKAYTTITISAGTSGADIWGSTFVLGFKH